MPSPIPILFVGDNPALQGGLARIGRDLATLVSRLPEFRVGFLGRGGTASRNLPFVQYPYPEATGQWGETWLPHVWQDFAGDQAGVIFTIWDLSRLHWFSRPQHLPSGPLRDFLQAGHFVRWGYFPIDSTGPGDLLPTAARDTLLGYDRVLAYTDWAGGLVWRSLSETEASRRGATWLPHGLNLNTFAPQDRRESRRMFPTWHRDDLCVGVVATNQARKDWGLVAMACRLLRDRLGRRFKAWWHTDVPMRHWNMHALIADYGLSGCVALTAEPLTDVQMAVGYSACNLTMHPGLGEGFCYPLAESLACGTPVLAGNYAGALELCMGHPEMLGDPAAMRLDTLHNCLRPVFDPAEWAERAQTLIESPPPAEECRDMVTHLDWGVLWAQWRKWFLGGL